MEIHDEAYVSLETAKLLKKAGFDWECSEHWVETNKDNKDALLVLPSEPCLYGPNLVDDDLSMYMICVKNYNAVEDEIGFQFYYSAPTLALVQKWLREVKNCHVWVEPGKITRPETSMPFNDIDTKEWKVYIWFGVDGHRSGTGFTYEEALEAGINGALMMLL